MKTEESKKTLLKENADTFLSIAHEFKLGKLPTESPNPKTLNLSDLAKENLTEGYRVFHSIDTETLLKMKTESEKLFQLKEAIYDTLKTGGRIYLSGCGATGRLSLSLETFWREHFQQDLKLREKVISFMAGGDVALIHSIEKFEDFPEFGERQLRENHFHENDLLISCTEGGETPFVIGATNFAAKYSKRKPFFLYCNPDDVLKSVATRSKEVLENDNICKINLTVGPMALTGSTRLQASTVLMGFVGFALLYHQESNDLIMQKIDKLIQFHQTFQYEVFAPFTKSEADHYLSGGTILYQSGEEWAITILTDTTERSPTFSLYSFENQDDAEKNPSLVYLYMKSAQTVEEAWLKLLRRKPRTFFWKEVTGQTAHQRLLGFQFHQGLYDKRKKYLDQADELFIIEGNPVLKVSFKDLSLNLDFSSLDLLSKHLMLKMLLNAHSTLLMGRLERYVGNLMTWVRPSNYKLIDRSVRYADILLKQQNKEVAYEKLVRDCYELKDKISRNEPIVLKIVQKNLDS